MPDLCEEMDETTLATFRDLFNMLDQSNTGIITVDNLYEELKRVDSEITYSEVEDVLKKVDKDGNGEIDFDEFLYHMTHMGGELFGEDGSAVDEDQKSYYSRRQRLFYSAITQFSLKQTLADIEKTFKKQAPHVISHYTAGVRLIGLTTRQLERQMKRMQKTASQNDSPYAKPLQFVHMGAKEKITHRKKIKSPGLLRDKQAAVSNRELNQVNEERSEVEKDTSVENLSQEISNTMRLFAQQRMSIVSKFQDANLIMQLRQKIGKVKAKLQSTDLSVPINEEDENIPKINYESASEETVKKKHQPKSQQFQCSVKERRKMCKRKPISQGWTTPRIQYMGVPLPSMKMKLKSSKPTFNDLHRIRATANEAIDLYYHNLRQTEIRNAWDHWDKLYADVILPKKLLENFRTVYSAYSPHREEEAFVVCPWKPGPFGYITHTSKVSTNSLPNSPNYMMRRGSKGVLKNSLVIRPLSSMASISLSQTPHSKLSSISSSPRPPSSMSSIVMP